MHLPLLPTLASAALLLAACTRAPAPTDAPPAPPATQAATPAPHEPASPPPAASPAPAAQLALSGDGLTFVTATGATRHLLFGTPAEQATEAVSRAFGARPEQGHNDECGAGPLDMSNWRNGLTLMAQDGRFVGWSVHPRPGTSSGTPPGTMAGIGPGSTRRELESAYAVEVDETTLGTEFTAGGLSGLLDGAGPAASITSLWAGANCVFR
ncbi:hypothetical protein [Luteimonas lutimaris]|uniref:Uncharacterized protein n=1 Tax=Luteimonas lutimaris TaxID=698645 RepID=A0ABP7MDI7_9GAMM